jgi:outer membrane protein OmpA-like peptidoglycan-associated protein
MGTVLVGCTAPGSGPGASRYEPTYLRLTEERQFAQALRQHYLELATNAFDRGAVERSDFYSLRALMAAEGKLARPGEVSRHAAAGEEAAAAGQRLNQALSSGARTGSPDLAARAQAAYDCWLVESGADGDPTIAQSCRFNALNALAQLEGASTGARLNTAGGPRQPQGETYVIEAGTNSQTINAAGGYTIQIITEQVAAPSHSVQMAAPAPQYTTIEAPAPRYATPAQPAPRFVQAAPMMQPVPASTRYVETMPIMQEQVAPLAPMPVQTYAPEYAPLAPMVVEAAPIMQEVPMMVEAAPMVAPLAPIQPSYSVERQAAQPIPVFNTVPVETMPMVEMAALPMTGDAAANALIEASANQNSDFSVFFGFDSDEVTLEGEDVLIDAVEKIRLSGVSRVTLMGFTDSVGDARYNQLLAMRRAQSVRKFLQGKLGRDIGFEILPVGEIQAVRNGGDGVKEALNRKVEIGLR